MDSIFFTDRFQTKSVKLSLVLELKFVLPVWCVSVSDKIEREKIILHEKNLKHRKIILLINFIFNPTFFLIASYQILKNHAILINYESFFQKKYFPQLQRF